MGFFRHKQHQVHKVLRLARIHNRRRGFEDSRPGGHGHGHGHNNWRPVVRTGHHHGRHIHNNRDPGCL